VANPKGNPANLRPPWKPGDCPNPQGRPKKKLVERLSTKVFEQHLRALIVPKPAKVLFGDDADGVPIEGESREPTVIPNALHPLVHSAVIKEAAKYSGALTEQARLTLLLQAAKERHAFADDRQWLMFVQAAAGVPIDKIIADNQPAIGPTKGETHVPGQQPGEASRDDDGGSDGDSGRTED
jgi:hypothetical protein